jgi:hypothetical protein
VTDPDKKGAVIVVAVDLGHVKVRWTRRGIVDMYRAAVRHVIVFDFTKEYVSTLIALPRSHRESRVPVFAAKRSCARLG